MAAASLAQVLTPSHDGREDGGKGPVSPGLKRQVGQTSRTMEILSKAMNLGGCSSGGCNSVRRKMWIGMGPGMMSDSTCGQWLGGSRRSGQ